MAFRLKRRRTIANELQRVLRSEFRAALDALADENPSEEAIHEARKSLKKIRAVLRLLQRPLGSTYSSDNRRLRGAAHRLAPIRDADAMLETVRLVHGRYPTVFTETMAAEIGRGLEFQRRKTKAHASRLVAPAIRSLRRSHKSVPNRVKRVGQFAAVRNGMVRVYRRARAVLDTLSMDSDATQFHAWRRRVKDHTYHVRLFEGLHRTAHDRAGSLKRLETLLGDDHNLAVLRSTVLGKPERFADARTTAIVLGCIVKAQSSCRQDALTLGRRLFARKPSRFRDAITAWRDGPTQA